jgi:histidinol-phosphatase
VIDESDDLTLAHQMADLADAIARRHFMSAAVESKLKSDGSPVTEADREIEHALRTLIGTVRPGDAFLGEEFGAYGHSRRRWIIDAIDGTASFLAGEPEWGTLIALADHDTASLGLVSAPACRRRWWAANGSGAWSIDLPSGDARPASLAVREPTGLSHAAVGLWPPPSRLDPSDRIIAATLAAHAGRTVPDLDWQALSPSPANARKPSTGSGTCHGALLVATGRLDAFVLLGAGTWDIAPLIPIVQEAGGVYCDLRGGQNADTGSALFATPGLHQQILEIIS